MDKSAKAWELLAKALANELNIKERREFEQLLLTDPDLAATYQVLQQASVNSSLPAVPANNKDLRLSAIFAQAQPTPVRQRFLIRPWGIAAAVLGISVTVGAGFLLRNNRQSTLAGWTHITTKPGTRYRIVLPDSTVVVLNAGSAFSYPNDFQQGNREVKLTGEAYFNVTQNAHAPFIIHTDEVDVKVLGTAFNLKAYPDDHKTETALISGAVEVTVKKYGGRKIQLKPNEKVTILKEPISSNEENVTTIKPAANQPTVHAEQAITKGPAAEETAWMENRLPFRNERFDDLALSIERRNDVKFVFGNENVRAFIFSGNIQGESLTDILKILQQIHPFEYTISGKTVIIN